MLKTSLSRGTLFSIFALLALGASPVLAVPYGWSPQVDFSWQGPPACTDSAPPAPILYQPNNPVVPQATEKGAIRLLWTWVPSASSYSVFYGLTPGNYIYSAADIGNTNTFTVRFLGSRKYYFAVNAKGGCASSGLSNEWWGIPNGGVPSSNTLGVATGFVPVVYGAQTSINTPSYVPADNTVVTGTPSVQGVSDQRQQPTQPVYQPPVNDAGRVEQPAVPVARPKPKGFLQWLFSLIGLGK